MARSAFALARLGLGAGDSPLQVAVDLGHSLGVAAGEAPLPHHRRVPHQAQRPHAQALYEVRLVEGSDLLPGALPPAVALLETAQTVPRQRQKALHVPTLGTQIIRRPDQNLLRGQMLADLLPEPLRYSGKPVVPFFLFG